MRRIMMITMLGCIIYFGQTMAYGAQRGEGSMIGIDISTAIRDNKAGIILSRKICDRWSVFGKADIRFASGPDLADRYPDKKIEDVFSAEIAVCCWPVSLFEGPYISIGAYCSERKPSDCSISLGYFCKTWENIKIGIGYHIRLVRSLRYCDTNDNGFDLSLCFTF